MWDCSDSQEVGLEAATLERVRNSSLVKWSCADNVTGLKHRAETADVYFHTGRVSSLMHRQMPKADVCVDAQGEMST